MPGHQIGNGCCLENCLINSYTPLLHPGAAFSYKEQQYAAGNVQLSFHDVTGSLVKVEADMDYYKDYSAHFFAELMPNLFSRKKTDPKVINILRWIESGKNLIRCT